MANDTPFNIRVTRQEALMGTPNVSEAQSIMVTAHPSWNVERIRISSGYFTMRVEQQTGGTYDTVTADLAVDVPSAEMLSAVVASIPSFFSKYETAERNRENLERLKGAIAEIEARILAWEQAKDAAAV